MTQDLIIACVQGFFCINLIPTIAKGAGREIPLFSSSTSVIGLLILSATFLTVPLFYSSITCLLVAISWAILLYQRLEYNKLQ